MARLIVCTDMAMGAPGADPNDGFALALAIADPALDVELVTTVSGQTNVDAVTTLTCRLLDRLGHGDTPVVKGAAAPLLRPRAPLVSEPYELPPAPPGPACAPAPNRAATAIADAILGSPGELTFVTIGPLTNAALALVLDERRPAPCARSSS